MKRPLSHFVAFSMPTNPFGQTVGEHWTCPRRRSQRDYYSSLSPRRRDANSRSGKNGHDAKKSLSPFYVGCTVAIPREEGKRAIAEGLTVRDSWLCDFDGQDGDIIVRRSVSTPFFEALRERCETIFQGTGAVGTKNLHEPFRTELIRISVGVHGLNNAIRVEKQPISRLHAEAVFLEMLVFDANRTVTLNS